MPDDPIWLIDALIAQAEISRENRNELTQGLQMAQEALALAKQLGDEYREMRSLIRIANAYAALNNPAWKELAEHALSLARQLGDLKTEVNLLLSLGGKYGIDDLPRSREYLQAALSRSETLNDKATKLSLLQAIGQQFERDGDYYRQLTEYEQERLRLSREIGNRFAEGNALMFSGQIQALYLGDYETGLELELRALRFWENINDRLFPLLRIAQIQTAQGRHTEALATLELARPLEEKVVFDVGRAGLGLVTVILYNTLGDEGHLQSVLNITSQIQQMVASSLVSRQYHMAAACEASAAHLKLAQRLAGRKRTKTAHQTHLAQALKSSHSALTIYEQFGFVQIVECTSQEIFYRHSQALAANDHPAEAAEFVTRAFVEMMRKHDLIPAESPYRKTYLENIQLHQRDSNRLCRAAYGLRSPACGFSLRSITYQIAIPNYIHMTLPSIQPFVRSRLTWLAYAMLAYIGFTQSMLGPLMPFLRTELSLNYTLGGLLPAAIAVGLDSFRPEWRFARPPLGPPRCVLGRGARFGNRRVPTGSEPPIRNWP